MPRRPYYQPQSNWLRARRAGANDESVVLNLPAFVGVTFGRMRPQYRLVPVRREIDGRGLVECRQGNDVPFRRSDVRPLIRA